MAAWSIALASHRGGWNLVCRQLLWTRRIGGITGLLGTSLASRCQPLANNRVPRCSSFATSPTRSTECLAGERSSSEGRRQELLWRRFFRDHSLWWDKRLHKKSSRSPDFRHKESQAVLWLNNFHKPAWVDAQLAALDIQMGRRAPTSRSGLSDAPYPPRPVRNGRRVTAETLSKLCQQGQLSEAVEGLGVLVQRDCPISKSILCTVLKTCAVKKDLARGRRVHALTVKMGYGSDTFLCNHIIRMYASHGRLLEAMDVFAVVAKPDAFTWSSIISAYVTHGQAKQAVQLYRQMRSSSVKPDGHVFVAALQACASGADLKSGQQVHADVLACGVKPDSFVCNSLVDMYAKCGSLEDARGVFDRVSQKNVVTWTTMIAGYSQQGMGQEALTLYSRMQREGTSVPDSVTFVCLLQACAGVGITAMKKGKKLHVQIKKQGLQADIFVVNSLINMYAKCGSLEDAQRVFDETPQKHVATWNAMIAGYVQQGMSQEALQLYSAMQQGGMIAPDSVTFVSLLQACACLGAAALQKGKQLHVHIEERGRQAVLAVGNSLVNMYAKCGSLEDAQSVFDGLPRKDAVTWNTMMTGYVQQGMGQEALRLYNTMQQEGISSPDSVTFVCLLQACASVGVTSMEKGKQLHAHIKERGLQSVVAVGNSLVNMYAKCGCVEDAQSVFDRLHQKDVVTWTTMIAGYVQQGMGQEALSLYSAMQEEGISAPDSVTFVCLLQACATVGIKAMEKGKQLHAQIEEYGLQADVGVANSLINMYTKCGSLEDGQSVFDGLCQKDVVTWTTMITAYSRQGMGEEALGLYSAMQQEGIGAPDSVTFVCLLQACATVGITAMDTGKQLHAKIEEQGLQSDLFVANSLINMYAQCGNLEDAQSVFDGIRQKNVVTWNAMIAGYAQQGMGEDAFSLYNAMQQEGIAVPDALTFVCLLQACASVSALHPGRQLHAQIQEQGLQANLFVANSLINMYAKSGSIVDAQQVFDALLEKNIVSWNALIAGYTREGDSEVVFDLIDRMIENHIQPNSITFLCVLTVCSHVGLVSKGREYFEAMSIQYGVTPTIEHYTCMVDLLGRAGRLDEALAVVRTMPIQPHDAVWHTLLGACGKWSNLEVGRHAFDEALRLDGKDAAAYVMMSNIYTGAQMLEEAREMQARRKQIRAWKQPGQSWWTDVDGMVHAFVVGDENHPKSEEIYSRVKQLPQNEERRIHAMSRLVKAGHV